MFKFKKGDKVKDSSGSMAEVVRAYETNMGERMYEYKLLNVDDTSKQRLYEMDGCTFETLVLVTDSPKVSCEPCSWVKYVGLIEIYEYCTKCDSKRPC